MIGIEVNGKIIKQVKVKNVKLKPKTREELRAVSKEYANILGVGSSGEVLKKYGIKDTKYNPTAVAIAKVLGVDTKILNYK